MLTLAVSATLVALLLLAVAIGRRGAIGAFWLVNGLAVPALSVLSMQWATSISHSLGLKPLLVLSELALALPAVLIGLALQRLSRDILASSLPSPRATGRLVLLGIAFWVLSLGVFEAQNLAGPPPPGFLEQFRSLHELLKPRGLLDWLFSVAAIAIAPAVCEEIVFRGFATPALARALGTLGSVSVSALLFAAIHIDSVSGQTVFYRVPFAFVLGALFAALRLRTGSVAPSVIAHATLNTTTFVLAPLLDDPLQTIPPVQPGLALALLAVGAGSAWWLARGLGPADLAVPST